MNTTLKWITALVGLLILFGILIELASPPKTEPKTEAQIVAESKADTRYKRVCDLLTIVKRLANDPKSIELAEAYYTSDESIYIKYRGRNAFNAMIINHAILANDGTIYSGSDSKIAASYNKYIAKHTTYDFAGLSYLQ